MKKLFLIFLNIVLIFSFTGCNANDEKTTFNKGGIFQGIADGYNGKLQVQISVNNGAINEIDILGNSDSSYEKASTALKVIPENIISNQSLNIEGVSGATITSKAIIDAVANAINSSGIDSKYFIDSTSTFKNKEFLEKNKYDLVVIGSGAAGLSAAIEGASLGKSVIVVEKLPFAGGNTALSGGEMSVPNNKNQKIHNIEDSIENLIEDMYNGSYETANIELITTLANNLESTVTWLEDKCNIEFYDDIYKVQGHSKPRTIMPIGQGANLVNEMVKKAESLGVEFLYNTKAISLIETDSKVLGIKVIFDNEIHEVFANERTIIATGGFSSNINMRQKYNTNDYSLGKEVLTSNSPGITGDGILMAENIGADIIDMNYIQLYPYGNPASGTHYFLDTIRIMNGAFIINKNGERFVSETEVRDKIAQKILLQISQTSYEVFNEDIINILKDDEVAMEELQMYFEQGVLYKGDTIEECAKHFGINPQVAKETLEKYNQFIVDGYDNDFGRQLGFEPLTDGPYYMLIGVPTVHHTMGGIKINSNAEVIDTNGNVINGLYAAGEVTGGVHGKNRLGACAIPDALVFGRIAGGYNYIKNN